MHLACRVVPRTRKLEELPIRAQLSDRHLVLRQRPGLVRADDRGAAERFDNGQAAHQRVPPDHAPHADRQRDRDDGRKGLGHHCHRQRDAEHEHLDWRQSARETDGDDNRDHHERGLAEGGAKAIEVLLERRAAGVDAVHHRGDLAELRRHTGGDDHGPATSVGSAGTRIDHVAAIADRQLRLCERGGRFFNRQRFAGERGFINGEIDRLEHAGIGGDAIARADHQHVAWHQFSGGEDHFLAIAHRARGRRGHLPQCLERPAGAVFLDEAEHHREQHDDRDDHGFERVAEETGHDRRAEQDQDQHVFELIHERLPCGDARAGLELVGPEFPEPPRGFRSRQAG